MKTLLRHTRTGLFLQGPKTWTSNAQVAYDFRFIDRALQFVDLWELSDVELAFAFDTPHEVTTAPLETVSLRYAA